MNMSSGSESRKGGGSKIRKSTKASRRAKNVLPFKPYKGGAVPF